MTPLRVGLVGAGPWAAGFHAPLLAAGPETELVAVWARRPEAAAALAQAHAAQAVDDLDELVELVDAIALAVPPDVQADLVERLAPSGRALLLEKPLGLDLAQAQRIADVVAAHDVPTMLLLTNRYSSRVRAFLAEARSSSPMGSVATTVNGAILDGGPFSTPWRREHGALLDVGPHVLDLIEAAVGPIDSVRADGDPLRMCALTVRHESGAVSQATLSLVCPDTARSPFRVYTATGPLELDLVHEGDTDVHGTIRADLARIARTRVPHELDVRHGLHLQRLLHAAVS
ncbi:unannotated protein [freshwater metagenome]|uniref:Unannotated protein n=1 Tax=freshwater metagenome TaxID=449393 RepID=A0A6J6SDQ8_9ZZZZ